MGAPPETDRTKNKTINKIELPRFSSEEIAKQSCWLERNRQQHWNLMIKLLRTSSDTKSYNKTELIGVIDTAWSLKQAQLLHEFHS